MVVTVLVTVVPSGVNLAGILGDAGWIHKACWGEGGGILSQWAGGDPHKRLSFSLEVARFGAF